MFHRYTLFSVIAAVLTLITPEYMSASANNGCQDFDRPVNESQEIPAEEIEAQVLAGCDPPCLSGLNDWCQQGGARRGSPGSGGSSVTTNVSKARMDCPPTRKSDSTCYEVSPKCSGKPGGQSVQGALSDCQKGTGTPTVGVSGVTVPQFPGFGNLEDFLKCLLNLILGGGGGGSASGGFDFSGGQACVSGSASICGFGVSGEVCTRGGR